jgi:hypothetical protein
MAPIQGLASALRWHAFLGAESQLHLHQKHKATVPESTLRVQMNGLEEQGDNAKAWDLSWKPLPKRLSDAAVLV